MNKTYDLVENLKLFVEDIQNEIIFKNESTPFTHEEVKSICTDYMHQYNSEKMTDYIFEYADSQVNIYWSDIYANASKFAEWTEQALKEYGLPKEPKLYKILQMGEFKAYENALYSNLEKMGLYCACENALNWIYDNERLLNKLEPYLSDEDKIILFDELEYKLDCIGVLYKEDILNMNDCDQSELEEIFNISDDIFEKFQAIQEIIEKKDILKN